MGPARVEKKKKKMLLLRWRVGIARLSLDDGSSGLETVVLGIEFAYYFLGVQCDSLHDIEYIRDT